MFGKRREGLAYLKSSKCVEKQNFCSTHFSQVFLSAFNMPGILNLAREVTAFSCVVSYPGCPDPPTDVLPAS